MRILILALVATCFIACGGDKVYTPKPKMYPRVIYPTKAYEDKQPSDCSFTFRAPTYADIVKDEYFYEDDIVDPCWFDIVVPELQASIHCSYYPLQSRAQLDELVADAFEVTNKHTIKANYIEEALIANPSRSVYGLLFAVDGPVATPLQFYLTDSTDHFFRASLYFDSKVNPDSTAPIVQYLQQDIDTIISSWQWQ